VALEVREEAHDCFLSLYLDAPMPADSSLDLATYDPLRRERSLYVTVVGLDTPSSPRAEGAFVGRLAPRTVKFPKRYFTMSGGCAARDSNPEPAD
jgi:hypothetical protein